MRASFAVRPLPLLLLLPAVLDDADVRHGALSPGYVDFA